MTTQTVLPPRIVSPEQWLAARRELLREEKELTQARERVAVRRRQLPWPSRRGSGRVLLFFE